MSRPAANTAAATSLERVIAAISQVLLGKDNQVRLAVACLLARGHLLIEDLPGVGKSTLAEALARSFGLAFKRVSFTSDLLPADLTGVTVFDPASGRFQFQSGPLFSQVLLADEINRASPRTQSALLEAMAAGRVSVDGISHPLPRPFVVIATQNGLDQGGTSALPESQLDRFLMRLQLGFPQRQAEAALLRGEGLRAARGTRHPAATRRPAAPAGSGGQPPRQRQPDRLPARSAGAQPRNQPAGAAALAQGRPRPAGGRPRLGPAGGPGSRHP